MYKRIFNLLVTGVLMATIPSWCFALVPLKSIILGDLGELYKEKSTDPIEYIFADIPEETPRVLAAKKRLTLYRGFSQEGENLVQFCNKKPAISYPNKYEEDQMVRSLMASLQFIGLDVTSRAIPKYARLLEFTEDEWSNLLDRLIGNYCSKNLSVISLSQLKKYMDIKFKKPKENRFKLPSVNNDPLFPKKLSSINDPAKVLEQEFLQAIKIFRGVCSWGGEITNARLLVPFLRNEALMAHVMRKMSGQILRWNFIDNSAYLYKGEEGEVPVFCQNLICRKMTRINFEKKVFRSVGSTSVYDDLKRLYCQDVRDVDFVSFNQVKQVKRWINKSTFDDFNLMVGHFIALLTGIPDLFVRAERFTDAKTFLRTSVDQIWENWAKSQAKFLNKDILYEEPLSMEVVDRNLFFNDRKAEFKVFFDVNLGEFDRITQSMGKVKVRFNLDFKKSFLKWVRREWMNIDPRNTFKKNHIINTFKKHIEDKTRSVRNKFIISPWDGDIDSLLAREILSQLVQYKGRYFERDSENEVQVPVVIAYAPFALRYIHYERDIQKAQSDLDFSTYEYND